MFATELVFQCVMQPGVVILGQLARKLLNIKQSSSKLYKLCYNEVHTPAILGGKQSTRILDIQQAPVVDRIQENIKTRNICANCAWLSAFPRNFPAIIGKFPILP